MRLPRKDGLNIVPFIDIMLVLLAIVLSTATFISQGHIKINPAESSSAQAPKDNQTLIITIDGANQAYIDGKNATLDEIRAKIKALKKGDLIELTSDKNATFQAFIDILDIIKESENENFVIKTKNK
ncbi:TonB system transport protein ExbD [Helicobacter sp. 23-1044]